MKRHSLFTRLTLFFLLILAAVAAGIVVVEKEIRQQHRATLARESGTLLGMLRGSIHLPESERRNLFQERGYSYSDTNATQLRGLSPVFATPPEDFTPEIRDSMKAGRIQILESQTSLYVVINRPEDPFMIVAPQPERYIFWLWSGVGLLLVLIFGFYLSVIRSLLPLKHLADAIKIYGEQGSYTPTQSSGKDEIAYVANAFDEAVRKNRSLTEARRLFMRNVMHELKTPITVGKLALPFLEESKESDMLARAFIRMEHLIDEMARIEQVTSRSAALHSERCSLKKLTDDAAELMIVDAGSIVREFGESDELIADCGMMTTVFKNLIDNAFKYSEDKRIVIRREEDRLLFINRGGPWPKGQQFEMLVEPFVHTRNSAATKSFGLGLYIIKSILEAQKMGFGYRYENGEHRFIIESVPFTATKKEAP